MDILLLALRLLLAGLLYGFLATLLVMLWRDLRQASGDGQATRPESRLVVLEVGGEASEELSPGTIFSLQPVTSIGRAPGNTVALPDTYVSAQHALLTWREGHWWVADRDSRNGTRLNGTPVEEPTLVGAGDVIAIGRSRLKLEVG